MTKSIYNPEELKRRRCDNSRRYRQKINFAHKVKQQSLKQSRMNKHIMNHPYLSINDKIVHHINNSERILSITRKFLVGDGIILDNNNDCNIDKNVGANDKNGVDGFMLAFINALMVGMTCMDAYTIVSLVNEWTGKYAYLMNCLAAC